jgi:DNA polymerase III subunit delta
VKPADVDRFVRKLDLSQRLLLVYGPDQGLVSERAGIIAKAHLGGSDDPFGLIRLEGDQVAADPRRVADEAYTVGMFGGRRVILLRVGSKPVHSALEPVVTGPAPEASVIVEGGDLKPSSPLRKLFESARNAVALPCYADEKGALGMLIDEEMAAAGLSITREARELVVGQLGGDRLASRQELRKLALYCHGRGQVTEEDVLAISGDVSEIGYDAVVDAMAVGESARMVRDYQRLLAEGSNASVMAAAGMRHCLQIHQARGEIDRGRAASEVIRGIYPQIIFKRHGAFERALVLFSQTKAEKAAEILQRATLEARRHPALAEPLVERAFLSVASLARRRG